MATTLTINQRWLLFAIGGWEMRECLLGPAGVDHFMTSMSSRYGHRPVEGGPSWLTGWNTRSRKITAPAVGEVRVVVTAAQINAYARRIPAEVRAELQACRLAAHSESTRVQRWCHCPYANEAPNAHSGTCQRYHPTDAEEDEHFHVCDCIRERTRCALRTALELDGGQLDLFAGSGQLALFDPAFT